MIRVAAVMWMTLRRLMRNRMVGVALVMALFIVGMQLGGITRAMQLHKEGRIDEADDLLMGMFPMFLAMLTFFGQLIALVVGGSVLRRDVIDGTVASVLSKPVSRGEYLAGTVAGGALYNVLAWAVFALVLSGIYAALGHPLGMVHAVAMAARLTYCLLFFCVALLFAMRFNPWVAAVGAMLFVNGPAIVRGVADLARALLHVEIPVTILDALVLPFPLTSSLDPATEALQQGSLSPRPVWPGFLHVLDYAAVAVICAYLYFRRLELNQVRD